MAQLLLSTLLISLFLILLIAVNGQIVPKLTCGWELEVHTGDVVFAGTDAKIDVDILTGPTGENHHRIENLGQYGGQNDIFERNQVDTFRFDGPCELPCRVIFFSDGSGGRSGWFLGSAAVRVTLPVVGRLERISTVNTWLSTSDAPYSLNATANFCGGLLGPGA